MYRSSSPPNPTASSASTSNGSWPGFQAWFGRPSLVSTVLSVQKGMNVT